MQKLKLAKIKPVSGTLYAFWLGKVSGVIPQIQDLSLNRLCFGPV